MNSEDNNDDDVDKKGGNSGIVHWHLTQLNLVVNVVMWQLDQTDKSSAGCRLVQSRNHHHNNDNNADDVRYCDNIKR